jgi:hypothetical protein
VGFCNFIAAQIDEAVAVESKKMQEISELRIQQAVREAEQKYADKFLVDFIDGHKGQIINEVIYEEGFASAQEMAAGIVHEFIGKKFGSDGCCTIAERIRAMEVPK